MTWQTKDQVGQVRLHLGAYNEKVCERRAKAKANGHFKAIVEGRGALDG